MSRPAQTPRRTECGDEPWHGTIGGYCNHRCSGDRCRAAWNAYGRVLRDRRAGTLAPDDPRHGKDSTYSNYKCKDPACRARHSELKRQRVASLKQNEEIAA